MLELRSREHETPPLTPAASAHTVSHTLRRIPGTCEAARGIHRLGRWMEVRRMAGANGVPSANVSIAKSSRAAVSTLTCDALMMARLSAVDRTGLRRVCWAQEQLALTCPSTRCGTLWDSNFSGLLQLLRGGARAAEGWAP